MWLDLRVCVCEMEWDACLQGCRAGPGWRPAETMGLENGVCLCVPLLSQREARQLSTLSLSLSLSPSLCLSRSLAGSVFFGSIPSFFACSLRSVSLSSLSAPLVIFSPLSPLHAPTVLMFSRHVSYPSCFLAFCFSRCYVAPLSFHTTDSPPPPISITDKVCVKLEVVKRHWNEKLELKLTNLRIYTPVVSILCLEPSVVYKQRWSVLVGVCVPLSCSYFAYKVFISALFNLPIPSSTSSHLIHHHTQVYCFIIRIISI